MKSVLSCVSVILLLSFTAIALAEDTASHTVTIHITHKSHMNSIVKNSGQPKIPGSVDSVKDEEVKLKSYLNWFTNQPGKKISVSVKKDAERDENIITSTSTAIGNYQLSYPVEDISTGDSRRNIPNVMYTMADDF